MWAVNGLLFTFALLFLMGMGMPVAFTMLAVGFGGLWLFSSPQIAMSMLGETVYSAASTQSLATIPLFVLMGMVFLKSGIGEDLFLTVQKWIGRIPGGLGAASIGGCGIFGAMCGSSTATTATIGTIAAPTMISLGYNRGLAAGLVAAGGALGPVIPPSIYMIVYGVCAQQSIGTLFIAAVIPGIILALAMMLQIIVMVKLNPKLAPSGQVASWSEKFKALRGLIIPIMIILVVLGSIYLGLSTPTEASAVGATASILFAFLTNRLKVKGFIDALATTTSFSCMVMLLIIGGSLLGKLFAMQQIPQELGAFTVGLDIPVWMIILAIQLVIFIGGMVIEGCALITILTPVFLPVIIALNFDPIVFGVAFMINLATAVITPPFAANLYVMDRILPDVPFIEIAKGALIFMIADLAVLLLVLFFPQLSLWLPSLMA